MNCQFDQPFRPTWLSFLLQNTVLARLDIVTVQFLSRSDLYDRAPFQAHEAVSRVGIPGSRIIVILYSRLFGLFSVPIICMLVK